MSRIRQAIAVVAVVAASLALVPAPASAVRPVREPLSLEPIVVEDVCSFPVLLEPIVNKEFITTFTDQEGNIVKQLITGRLVTRMTNLRTDESVVVNTSGPGKLTFEGDTTFLQGRGVWLLFFFPEQLGEGDPGLLVIVRGSFLLTIGPDGSQTLSNVRGNVTDVCKLLA
jgi:hypothetical protein